MNKLSDGILVRSFWNGKTIRIFPKEKKGLKTYMVDILSPTELHCDPTIWIKGHSVDDALNRVGIKRSDVGKILEYRKSFWWGRMYLPTE